MNYVDRDEVIGEIWNEMASYKNLGNVDESFLYPIIDLALSKLKCKTKVYKSAILNIDRFKVELPSDFGELKFLFRCSSVKYTYTNPTRQSEEISEQYVNGLEQRSSWQGFPKSHKCLDTYTGVHTCGVTCGANCDYGDGNYYIRNIYNDISYDITNINKLVVTNNPSSVSRNVLQQNMVTIQNGFINTCFQEGIIFLEYRSTETDGLIPDIPEVRNAIKDICKHELFRIMFYNGEQDVIQRMQNAEKYASIGYSILKKYAATNEVSDFYSLRKNLINRHNIMDKLTRGHFTVIRKF